MASLLLVLAMVLAPHPAAEPAEAARVHAHLVAARAWVQSHDTAALTPAQRHERAAALANLDRYIEIGEFPRRTDDAFAGLRPRFIDDRGVHCAVGYMIASSGEPALARAINRDFEYAYVRDIASPVLLAWATDHGFTVEELARIQPSYRGPPTSQGVKHELEESKDDFLLTCADEAPPTSVKVVATGDEDGRVRITAVAGADRFATCFAEVARKVEEHGGGAYMPSPTPFSLTIELSLSTPNQLLAARIRNRLGIPPECAPKPGATPSHATVEIGTEFERMAVHVTTAPTNAAINECIQTYLEAGLRDFITVPGLAFKERMKLPRMESSGVRDAVLRHAPTIATDCYVAETAPAKLTVTVTAAKDDKAFTIATDTKNETFARCLADKLAPKLRGAFTKKGYFRIDNAITATLTFAIETPTARDQRLAKAREAAKKQRSKMLEELEKERRRRPYDF
jgi:hypothetical protein